MAAADGKGVARAVGRTASGRTTGTRHDNATRASRSAAVCGRGGRERKKPWNFAWKKAAGKRIRGNTGVGEVGRTNYRRRRAAISRTIRYVRFSGTKPYRICIVGCTYM